MLLQRVLSCVKRSTIRVDILVSYSLASIFYYYRCLVYSHNNENIYDTCMHIMNENESLITFTL